MHSIDPVSEYLTRLERWRGYHDRDGRLFIAIGNWRLVIAIAAAILAWLAFARDVVSGWWLLVPLAAFIVLIIYHEQVFKRQRAAKRAMAYYERGLARLDGRWAGTGNSGDRFRTANHVYADDIDVFGRGSLFELLCTARTTAGEEVLASWLLEPGLANDVLDRQKAVVELQTNVQLREDLALLGEEVRAGVHPDVITNWGAAPPVNFPPFARIGALILAVAGVASFVGFFAHFWGLRPFLILLLLDSIVIFALRRPRAKVLGAIATPEHELEILSLVVERLEREQFAAPRLVALRSALETTGAPASRRIAQLQRWIEFLDSSDHLFVRLVAPVLLWREQIAMGIEHWRRRTGPEIGKWIAAVGELEALCSLACYAFENATATFPELAGGPPVFDAEEMRHPLIEAGRCVPNSVTIGGDLRLLIVSGSNMSGKSTLLRAIGLTTVLAWAGAPVPSRRLRISPFAVGASVRIMDSLQDGRSRFYAEITRLRDIVNLTAGKRPVLFLLDELLSGTNSHDRRIGAEAVVKGLIERGAIGLITTHDLALVHIADELDGRAANVHFEDQIENGQIRFDYKMRPGVVTRSNALELMRAIGLEV